MFWKTVHVGNGLVSQLLQNTKKLGGSGDKATKNSLISCQMNHFQTNNEVYA